MSSTSSRSLSFQLSAAASNVDVSGGRLRRQSTLTSRGRFQILLGGNGGRRRDAASSNDRTEGDNTKFAGRK